MLAMLVTLAVISQTPPTEDAATRAAAAAERAAAAAEKAAAAAQLAAESAARVTSAQTTPTATAPAAPAEPKWTGTVGASLISLSGNASTLTFNGSASAQRHFDPWIVAL